MGGVDLTIAGAMGLKSMAASQAAVSAIKEAAANAVSMAQNANLAAAQAEQAQKNLEHYIYGTPVSTVPPTMALTPPAAIATVAKAAMDPTLLWAFTPQRFSRTAQESKEARPRSRVDFL